MLESILLIFVLSSAANDLANERFVVSGIELEKHWQIDCRQLVDQYDRLFANPAAERDASNREILISTAQKCAIIYNTVDTIRTIECPDYHLLGFHLKRFYRDLSWQRPQNENPTSCREL